MKALAVALAALVVGGCSLSPSAEFMAALAQDPATVSVRITTIYGTISIYRTGTQLGAAESSADGVKVNASTAGTVSVPIMVPPMTLTPR